MLAIIVVLKSSSGAAETHRLIFRCRADQARESMMVALASASKSSAPGHIDAAVIPARGSPWRCAASIPIPSLDRTDPAGTQPVTRPRAGKDLADRIDRRERTW